MTCYPCINLTFDLIIDSLMPFLFYSIFHRLLSALMALRFDFEQPTQQIAVIFLTFNMLVKRYSDFPAFGLLTVVWVIGKLGLSSVIYSGEETIAASRISLKFCWPSHLPEF